MIDEPWCVWFLLSPNVPVALKVFVALVAMGYIALVVWALRNCSSGLESRETVSAVELDDELSTGAAD